MLPHPKTPPGHPEPMDETDGSRWASLPIDGMRAFVARNAWRYAATMPRFPHEYVVLKTCSAAGDFFRFAMTVRRNGYDEHFFSKKLRYLDLDGCRYWTMGYDLATTCIINRARNDRPDIAWPARETTFVPIRWVPPGPGNPPHARTPPAARLRRARYDGPAI